MDKRDKEDPFSPQDRYHGLSYAEVQLLATYNGERARGIMHTVEWQDRISYLQERWDNWIN